jgi:pSer/pThr/pTyr-binding forkhead associated (FHA) protein
MPKIIPASGPPADGRHVAFLAWGEGESDGDHIELTTADMTLGREADAVDVILDDPSVSRLHARIRRNAAGEYWLYDEGSIMGTFLNYERLGLAPRRMQHGDVVQIGRVTLRFRLELPRQTTDEATPVARRQTTDDN